MSNSSFPQSKSWRDYLAVHPAADFFPLLAEYDPDAFKELVDDIKVNGLVERPHQNRKPVFVIELQPARPGPNDIRALRAILKALLRRYGWRCTDAREEPATTTPERSLKNDTQT